MGLLKSCRIKGLGISQVDHGKPRLYMRSFVLLLETRSKKVLKKLRNNMKMISSNSISKKTCVQTGVKEFRQKKVLSSETVSTLNLTKRNLSG